MNADLFASRLRQLRQAAGLSQTELAELAGSTQRTISAYENGLTSPSLATAVALAEALGVGLAAFVYRAGSEDETARPRRRPPPPGK